VQHLVSAAVTNLERRLLCSLRRFPMPTIDSLETLLTNELRDLLDAENRLTKVLPKLAKASANEELRTAFEEHLDETQEHVTRVEKALKILGAPIKAKPCHGIRGIIDEGSEMMQEDYEDDALKDAAIIGGAQRAEHYEIAAYGTVLAYAKQLGQDQIINLLKPTLEEEKAADEKLTQIAESVVNTDAASDDKEEMFAGAGAGRGSRTSSSSTRRGNGRARGR
jgi:ferritin-like metal-binding protein YciE